MIREATHEDLERLLVLGYEMHQESRYKTMQYNLEKVAEFFTIAIDKPEWLALVVEIDGQVVGGFVGYAMPQWFSDDLFAGDNALFIEQRHRGGTAAARLIKKFSEWALSKGVKPGNISLGITTGVHMNKTQSLYEKLGLEQTGVILNFKA